MSNRPATSGKSICDRLGGCDGCTYVSHGGGWNVGGYYIRADGRSYCHCPCHK